MFFNVGYKTCFLMFFLNSHIDVIYMTHLSLVWSRRKGDGLPWDLGYGISHQKLQWWKPHV